jgi:hypothetical protein
MTALRNLLLVATALGAGCATTTADRPAGSQAPAPPPVAAPPAAAPAPGPGPEPQILEVNKAVMVTVELDFGPRVPTVAEALKEIERRYEPEDRQGRTFAVLDAYGEPTADGKRLHLSMHVSTEKTGAGSLVFRRTGEVLWRGRITPGGAPPPYGGKQLRIMVDDGKGNSRLLDGSKQPPTILDAVVNDLKVPLRDYWPDGQEREVTFVYSACGCPVKVMAKRVGERTMRTKDLPVIFPDDPAAAAVINKLMGW